jgi:hypothetical protein
MRPFETLAPTARASATILLVVAIACSGGGGDGGGGGGGGGITAPPPPPPPTPAAIILNSGGNQSADAGAAFAAPISVTVTSSTGTVMPNVAVSFAVSSGAATVNPPTAVTNAQGAASTTVQAGATPGPVVITASVAGVATPATANLTVRFNFATIAGQWDGTTSQNLPVYLRITSTGLIDSLTVRARANLGILTCTATMATRNIQIQPDGSFSAPLSIPLLWTTTLRGNFASGTAASGVLDQLVTGASILCGSSFLFGSIGTTHPGGTWTGTKRP